jgi:hypothetical protein
MEVGDEDGRQGGEKEQTAWLAARIGGTELWRLGLQDIRHGSDEPGEERARGWDGAP